MIWARALREPKIRKPRPDPCRSPRGQLTYYDVVCGKMLHIDDKISLLWAECESLLSSERLNEYIWPNKDAGQKVHALARNLYNTALCESLYPSLNGLEVAYRNSMHNALTKVCGRADWFEMPTFLRKDELDKVTEAKGRLVKNCLPTDTGHVVAELTFGFWSSLLDDRYKRTSIVNCIDLVFPNVSYRKRDRETMLKHIEKLRRLRNRVFHHEPIWHWSDLKDQHDLLYHVLGGINKPYAEYVALADRFPEVLEKKWDGFREMLLQKYAADEPVPTE